MPPVKEYHKILGIERDASPEEIKQAYRNKAKKFHPDINNIGSSLMLRHHHGFEVPDA